MKLFVANEHAQQALGKCLADFFQAGEVVFLTGHLGAGKTTLVRGLMRGNNYIGAVKSPTYTLVETYDLPEKSIYHFDLYRLSEPEELDYMGARDYFTPDSLCLIEWPEQGGDYLPKPDWRVDIQPDAPGRIVTLSGERLSDELVTACTALESVRLV